MTCKCSDKNVKLVCSNDNKSSRVYGEFIRTFVFGDDISILPIVQPGESISFPTPTVVPSNITYIDEPGRIGFLVPRGTYRISYSLVPGIGARVNLLVNGRNPLTTQPNTVPFPYTHLITSVPQINVEYFIEAPLRHRNLISLINGGTESFALASIPNTLIGRTAVLTHIKIERIDKYVN